MLCIRREEVPKIKKDVGDEGRERKGTYGGGEGEDVFGTA